MRIRLVHVPTKELESLNKEYNIEEIGEAQGYSKLRRSNCYKRKDEH